MNAKIAADKLDQFAAMTDELGEVPVDQVASLVAALEVDDNINPQKAITAFRALAAELQTQTNPSRTKLAAVLRRILADTMPVAGAGAAFQKANPAITDAQAEKIDEMHEKHRDNFKNAGAEDAETYLTVVSENVQRLDGLITYAFSELRAGRAHSAKSGMAKVEDLLMDALKATKKFQQTVGF